MATINKHYTDLATKKINLNEKESKICDLLENVCQYLKESNPTVPQLELRIAGGWVRDKLLGKESHDIDVAVSKLSGFEFASYVNEYLIKDGQKVKSIAKIAQNPEKSKHLETSKTSIFGQEIDFVNLRSEVYNDNSRIPSKIEFGTPLEDAERRDITINSLFYNIISREVEDFTEKGLDDLSKGIIRTPISPSITFRDDPLRVLRVIRFASRFGFKLDEEIEKALTEQDIKDDFKNKISKERVGDELYKMVSSDGQINVIDLIVSHGWYFSVFEPPSDFDAAALNDVNPELAVSTSSNLSALASQYNNEAAFKLETSDLAVLYLASYTLPYSALQISRKEKLFSLASIIARENLKARNSIPHHDIDKIEAIHTHYKKIKQILQRTLSSELYPNRVEIGLLIREIGSLWKVVNIFNAAVEMTNSGIETNGAIEQLKRFDELVDGYGLGEAYKFKYLLNGKEIAQLLNLRPGPKIKSYLDGVMVWQLEHPEATKEECKEYVLGLSRD